jgi:hypothetical protein
VQDLENLSCGSPNLILRESVQPLQDRVDVLCENLDKVDCDVLNKIIRWQEADSLDRPSLSSMVARAIVDNNSTIILTTISPITGEGGICVYISRQVRK